MSEGGSAQKQKVEPGIGTKLSSLIAVPKSNLRKQDIFKAESIDEFAKKTSEVFSFDLKEANGSTLKEAYKVESFEDIHLQTICEKSAALSKQNFELNFLRRFIDKWREDPNFRSSFIQMLKDPQRRDQAIKALRLIQFATEQKQIPSSFINFLNQI